MLDLRIPCGSFFALLGFILIATGLFSPDSRAPLSETNVNLYAGIVMLLFGSFMLALAQRARRRQG